MLTSIELDISDRPGARNDAAQAFLCPVRSYCQKELVKYTYWRSWQKLQSSTTMCLLSLWPCFGCVQYPKADSYFFIYKKNKSSIFEINSARDVSLYRGGTTKKSRTQKPQNVVFYSRNEFSSPQKHLSSEGRSKLILRLLREETL